MEEETNDERSIGGGVLVLDCYFEVVNIQEFGIMFPDIDGETMREIIMDGVKPPVVGKHHAVRSDSKQQKL